MLDSWLGLWALPLIVLLSGQFYQSRPFSIPHITYVFFSTISLLLSLCTCFLGRPPVLCRISCIWFHHICCRLLHCLPLWNNCQNFVLCSRLVPRLSSNNQTICSVSNIFHITHHGSSIEAVILRLQLTSWVPMDDSYFSVRLFGSRHFLQEKIECLFHTVFCFREQVFLGSESCREGWSINYMCRGKEFVLVHQLWITRYLSNFPC